MVWMTMMKHIILTVINNIYIYIIYIYIIIYKSYIIYLYFQYTSFLAHTSQQLRGQTLRHFGLRYINSFLAPALRCSPIQWEVMLSIWVCLKMLCIPKPNGFADHYPVMKNG